MTPTLCNDYNWMIHTKAHYIAQKMTGYRQTKWLNSRLINNKFYLKIIIHRLTNYASRLVFFFLCVRPMKIEIEIKCILLFNNAIYNGTLATNSTDFWSNYDEPLFHSVLSLCVAFDSAAWYAWWILDCLFGYKWYKLSFPCFNWKSVSGYLRENWKKKQRNEWWKHQWYAHHIVITLMIKSLLLGGKTQLWIFRKNHSGIHTFI